MDNLNLQKTIDNIWSDLLQQIQDLQGAPSVSMQVVPPLYEVRRDKDAPGGEDDDKDGEDKDDDDDDDDENDNNSQQKHRPAKKRTKRKYKEKDTRRQHPAEYYDKVD
mgnify:CR=1 FL=1